MLARASGFAAFLRETTDCFSLQTKKMNARISPSRFENRDEIIQEQLSNVRLHHERGQPSAVHAAWGAPIVALLPVDNLHEKAEEHAEASE